MASSRSGPSPTARDTAQYVPPCTGATGEGVPGGVGVGVTDGDVAVGDTGGGAASSGGSDEHAAA
jgi:hypothetical protein